MRRLTLIVALLALPLAGCRGGYGMRCEDPERYAGSAEVPPVQVPDDLSVPSENGALRIPPGGQLPQPQPQQGRCLESPPSYFDGGEGTAGAQPGGAAGAEAR